MSVEACKELLQWLSTNGGEVHKSLSVKDDASSGFGLFAVAPIEAEECIVACPFDLAITPQLATEAICEGTGVSKDKLQTWNERMRIAGYLMLHDVNQHETNGKSPSPLRHREYIASLPPTSTLLTPLYFTSAELALLEGSNLYGAVHDTQEQWKSESEIIRSTLSDDSLTWEKYRAAATYITSRSFPSSLLHLSSPSSSKETKADAMASVEEAHPVLLPGLDILNHARGQAVTWQSAPISTSSGSKPCVSIITNSPIPVGAQAYNNYGPKSNESLLLGYGFDLEDNPDDTVILKLGAAQMSEEAQAILKEKSLDPTQRFSLRRDGIIPKELMEILRIMIGGRQAISEDIDEDEDDPDPHAEHEKEVRETELELDVLGTLGSLLETKLDKLPTLDDGSEDVRPGVLSMCRIYVKGQRDILQAAVDKVGEKADQLESMMDQGMGGCPCGC